MLYLVGEGWPVSINRDILPELGSTIALRCSKLPDVDIKLEDVVHFPRHANGFEFPKGRIFYTLHHRPRWDHAVYPMQVIAPLIGYSIVQTCETYDLSGTYRQISVAAVGVGLWSDFVWLNPRNQDDDALVQQADKHLGRFKDISDGFTPGSAAQAVWGSFIAWMEGYLDVLPAVIGSAKRPRL